MTNWLEDIGGQLWQMVDVVGKEVRGEGMLALLRPVAPFNRPQFLAPAITIGALLSFLVLSGIAVASLGALLTALLALYLMLVQVFGVSVELRPIGGF
jgi:hypothetical protein